MKNPPIPYEPELYVYKHALFPALPRNSGDSFIKTTIYSHVENTKRPLLKSINSGLSFAWRRPTLPGPCGPSTIGAGGLNGRVRDGYVWNPSAIATKRDFCAASLLRYRFSKISDLIKGMQLKNRFRCLIT